MKEKLHYIAHTHWDKEWYKTFEEFRVKFIKIFSEILTVLENDQDFKHFMFDGQSSIIDDYLQIYPEQSMRVKNLITKKKLLIGPWYTLPDNYLTNGESLTRNLLLGSNLAKTMGHSQKVCYIPDSFGQTDQMPQIINDMKLKGALLWRGVDSTMTNNAVFNWQGSSQDSILAIHLPLGYGYSKRIPENGKHFEYIDFISTMLRKKYKNDLILLMGGSDHEPIQKKLPELLKEINQTYQKNNLNQEIIISTIDDFYDEIVKKVQTNDLTTLTGELRSVRDQRVHFGDASSRMDIKQLNRILENKLTTWVEPILSINQTLTNYQYSHELINYAWKLMFANQAHDSACTTGTDKVHQDIVNRYHRVNQICNEVIHYANKNLIESIKKDDSLNYFLVYNTNLNQSEQRYQKLIIYTNQKNFKLLNEQKQVINYSFIKQELTNKVHENIDYCNYLSMFSAAEDFQAKNKGKSFSKINHKVYKNQLLINDNFIKPMSCKLIYIKPSNKEINKETNNYQFNEKTLIFENKWGKYQVNTNGTLNLIINNQRYENLVYFESKGDAGDSYDYSPPKKDRIYNTLNAKPKIKVVNSSANHVTIKVTYNWFLPEKLIKKDTERSNKLVANKIDVTYQFYAYQKNVNLNIVVKNQSCDHILTVNLANNYLVTDNFAGQQFGTIKRVNTLIPDIDWIKTSRSKNYALYPFQKFVALTKNKQTTGLGIQTLSSSEYEIENNQIIKIVLLRSFGYMGKANLEFRPGRPSGINWPTPDSLMKQKMHYKINLLAFNTFHEFVSNMNDFFTPLKTYEVIEDIFFQTKDNKINLNDYPLIECNNQVITLSTLKVTEDKKSYLLRIYNETLETQKNICFFAKNKTIYQSNLLEEKEQKLGKEKVLISELKPNKFLTLLFE